MEYSTRQAIKYILTTYNDGKTNKLYDSTFRLRPPFKPNSNGQYKITINECLFQNNEPTLMKDVDYLEFTIYKNGVKDPIINRFTITEDIFTFKNVDEIKVLKALNYKRVISEIDSPSGDNKLKSSVLGIRQISIKSTESDDELVTKSYFTQNFYLEIFFDDIISIADISKVSLKTSTNFGYLFNDLRTEIFGEKSTSSFKFNFHNPRFGGPYLYILKTPLQATVPTYNSLNQGYNVVACTYNPNGYHNSNVQMCSSMEVVSNDLSNFRIELVNDQYEPIRINTPIYLQITVSNQ